MPISYHWPYLINLVAFTGNRRQSIIQQVGNTGCTRLPRQHELIAWDTKLAGYDSCFWLVRNLAGVQTAIQALGNFKELSSLPNVWYPLKSNSVNENLIKHKAKLTHWTTIQIMSGKLMCYKYY